MKLAYKITRDRGMTLSFLALSFALAFWQTPGLASSDTKIDLHIDPARFLQQVASVWTPTNDLGNVHSSQYSGYLWPMGPFFLVLHAVGLSAWVGERLWLGTLFAFSAWGTLRLLDALVGRPRGIAHVVAAAFYLLNPFVVVFTARTSLELLGYAALPWLLLVTYHGVRAGGGWRGWRGWWWAAAFALILATTGGGVNAALVGWILVGPLVLALYEPTIGAVRWRDSLWFLGRAGFLGLVASLWWIVPVLVHVHYGIDFLKYTEQPSTIWATNSSTESLRLMGFWTSYGGVGYGVTRALYSDAGTMLFNPIVVGASLLLPAIAVAAFLRSRRPSYAPLFIALVLVGTVIMVAGFPAGTPLRSAMLWVYQHVFVLRFMRTTYKAGPIVAVGIAGLLGLAAQQLLARLRGRARRRDRGALVPLVAALPLIALIVLGALPLVQGKAIDRQYEYKRIPSAWTKAGHDLDRTLAPNTRALLLPGQIFAFYNWGGTGDAILPRLTNRPVAVRYETPYSDLHAAELLTDVDDLVQQRRLVPGQLSGLLHLMGVGAVITGSDDDISRSGAIDPAAAAGVLSSQLPAPSASYGAKRRFPPASGDLGAPVTLPEVRRYDVPGSRGIVHIDPTGPATVLDGGAAGLADLSAFGELPARSPIFYAADLSAGALRRQAARGGNVVISDSNRRSEFVPEFTTQNHGPTLGAAEAPPTDAALLDPFSARGTDAQTVSVLQGARSLGAPVLAGQLQFPDHAPIAAFDGDLSTSWVADRLLPQSDAAIEIGFNAPRDVPYVDVYPLSDAHALVTQVDVNGISRHVGTGWTRIPLGLHGVAGLRIAIDHVIKPGAGFGSHGGFREIRIPGLRVRQLLRPPVLAAKALAGVDLRRDALTFLFERTTGDDPFRRNLYAASSLLNVPQEGGDAEKYIDRLLDAPVARSYTATAWIYPAPDTPDSALDRLAGAPGGPTFDSSSRFQNQPSYRASRAFDGRSDPGWIGVWAPPNGPAPWISWATRRPLTVSRLVLKPPALPVRRPTEVRLSWSGGATPALRVGGDGSVVLPAPARARSFKLTVLQASFPASATPRERHAIAVGIGSVLVPGLHARPAPRSGQLRAACGTIAILVAGRRYAMKPVGTIEQLDAGQPLRAVSCAGAASMPAGLQEVRALPGVFSVDLLQLRSPAPVAPPASSARGGQVVNPGSIGQSSVSGVRVKLAGPSWIVLGESFDTGWSATCDGRSLGAPQVIDGYANGWAAPSGCRRVEFSFAPQAGANASYVVSAVSCLAMILLIALGGLLGRPVSPGPTTRRSWLEPVTRPLSLPRAVAIALALAIPLGAVFALRVGGVSFPLLTLVLWRGVGFRALVRIAVGLLAIAIPFTYLITQPQNLGGFDFAYSTNLLWAHWIGIAALVLLGLATFKELMAARQGTRRGGGPGSVGGGLNEDAHDPARRIHQEVVRS